MDDAIAVPFAEPRTTPELARHSRLLSSRSLVGDARPSATAPPTLAAAALADPILSIVDDKFFSPVTFGAKGDRTTHGNCHHDHRQPSP